jgi:hypothetical protein
MRITLVDGVKNGPDWDEHRRSISKLKDSLSRNHMVDYFPIAEIQMAHCQGCWDCWTKTPGVCRLKDDGVDYLKSLIKSDLLLYVSHAKDEYVECNNLMRAAYGNASIAHGVAGIPVFGWTLDEI